MRTKQRERASELRRKYPCLAGMDDKAACEAVDAWRADTNGGTLSAFLKRRATA